jgi:2-phospho-L-lactate/phosphoenolpyruvate guanylyltransferase
LKINAIIPVKSLTRGKTRLAGFLDDSDRIELNTAFLDHALGLAAAFPGLSGTIVVSADNRALDIAKRRGAHALRETGGGLNPALAQAMAAARQGGARAVLVLPTDLPRATAEDVMALTRRPPAMAIASDRRGIGTNALFVPTAREFTFRFGEDSFAAHLAEARISGLCPHIVDRPNLGFDIDTPEDYRSWRALN